MIPPRWFMRIGWALDRRVSRLTKGRITMPSGTHGQLKTLYLRSIGHASGQPRRTGLYYITDGPNLVVIASNAGAGVDPAWWRNLQAEPAAEVEVGATVRPVRARRASPDEAGPLYARFVAAMPQYDEYRRRTTRTIPVVILEPR